MFNVLFRISVFVIRGISLYLTNSTFWAKEGRIQQCCLGGKNQKLHFFFCFVFGQSSWKRYARMKKCLPDRLLKMINVATYNMNPVNQYT